MIQKAALPWAKTANFQLSVAKHDCIPPKRKIVALQNGGRQAPALPHEILFADCARKFDCLLRAILESPLPRLRETIGHRPFKTTVNKDHRGYRKQYPLRDGRGAPWCSRFRSQIFRFLRAIHESPLPRIVLSFVGVIHE